MLKLNNNNCLVWMLGSLILLMPKVSFGQCTNVCGLNLVPNGDFEATNAQCSDTISELFYSYSSVQGWYGTDDWTCYPQPPGDCGAGSTPDYHNPNCNGPANEDGCGVGSGAAGVFNSVNVGGSSVSGGTVSQNREYIQVELTTPLVAGKEYCASMVVRSDYPSPVMVSSDGIGMWFTDQKVNIDTQNGGQQFIGNGSTINAIPQIQNPSGNIIDSNCTVISGTFCASGGEKWLVIGNFRPDSLMNTNDPGFFGIKINYMLIDDVSVKTICPPNPQLNLSNHSIVCGNPIDVEITNAPIGATIEWLSPSNFTGNTSTGPYSDTPNSTTEYTAVVTVNNSCGSVYKDTLRDTLFVNCGSEITLNLLSDTICEGSCTNLEATITGGLPPYTVTWNNGLVNGTGPYTVCPSTTTVYNATVTDFNGDIENATITLHVRPPDSTYILHQLCNGDSINLYGNSIYSSGIYPQNFTNMYGCDSIEYNEVVVLPSPTYTTTTMNPTCGNNDGEIVITPDPGFTITDYSINGGTTTQSGGTFSNLGANTYNIVITDNNGCDGTGTENLINIAGPTIDNITSIDASCSADDGTITVTASGGATPLNYELNNGQTSTNGVFTGVAEGNYTVAVTDFNGCVTTQTLTVGKASGPTLTVVNSTDISCFGADDGSGEVNANGGTSPYLYSWSPSGGNAATATDLPPGNYTVSVTDGGGCSDDVQITITEPNEIQVLGNIGTTICGQDNGMISLDVTGGTGNYTYNWNPNVSSTDEATNLAIGTYDVAITDGNGCSKTVSYDVTVGASFYIDAAPNEATILQGESTNINLFIDTAVTVDTIIWTPSSSLSCSDCKKPIATPSQSTTYIVTVMDNNGCISTDTVVVNVTLPCAKIFVPNSFSPNSDGLNDLQCVLGECIVSMEFTVFNRWGEIVFQTEDQKECWDGTFRGKLVQSGAYVYKLRATLDNGKQIKTSGNLTLVR